MRVDLLPILECHDASGLTKLFMKNNYLWSIIKYSVNDFFYNVLFNASVFKVGFGG